MPYESELEAARQASRRAAEAAMRYWRTGIEADAKSDESPVTAADRECERLIVQDLCAQFPEDGVLGEEGADKPSATGRRWIIDPIDGTRDFMRGNRAWCNLIALEDNGEVVVGVTTFPAVDETYWAVRGGGAFRNGTRIRVSSIKDPSKAVLCVNSFNGIQQTPFANKLMEWMRGFWSVRSMGGAVDATLVAAGHAEAWIEVTAKPWDLAVWKILTEEAGGRFFNFDGGNSIYGGNCVTCVPALETLMRRFVAG
ncbi:MAG: inositol monophosphatase [Acidobacteria bacterium]|nr:inositol monophosphatase [Acidobacteriota bacterium]